MSRPVAKQCAHCPWKTSTDPDADIPGGYCRARHRALSRTIADPGSLSGLGGPLRAMACHESAPGAERPCVGWVANQLGPGNNLALRLRMVTDPTFPIPETVGEQHARFEDTLPESERWEDAIDWGDDEDEDDAP